MVYYLCPKEAHIDVGVVGTGPGKDTELMHAIRVNNLPLIQFFVEAGANVNAYSGEQWTVLNIAAKANGGKPSPEVINYLISKGANVNKVNKYGNTPLMSLVNFGDLYIANTDDNIEVAKISLDAGTDTSKKV